jgi:DNA polymerase-3 subunit delta'
MLIGQPRVEAMLSRALQRDRVCHAYLFLGPEGVGKATAAMLLAQTLNCERLPEPGDPGHPGLQPCGACDSCRRIDADNHPDVRVLTPQTRSGQNIGVEQARAFRRDAQLRPKTGRRKVYVVPNAELMNEEAANTALKTLEEPNPYVTILLCAPAASNVLPTIQSRCQWVRFGLAAPQVIAEALANSGGVDAETAGLLARLSGGRPGLARRWATEPAILERRRGVLALIAETERCRQQVRREPGATVAALRLGEELRAIVGAGQAASLPAGRSRQAGSLSHPTPAAATREELRDALDFALSFYRDALALAEGVAADSETLVNPELSILDVGCWMLAREDGDKDASAPSQSKTQNPESRIQRSWAELVGAIGTVMESQRLLARNVTPQLVLERMFLRLLSDGGEKA